MPSSLVATTNEELPVRSSTLSSNKVCPSNSVAPGLNTAFTVCGKSEALMIGLRSWRWNNSRESSGIITGIPFLVAFHFYDLRPTELIVRFDVREPREGQQGHGDECV